MTLPELPDEADDPVAAPEDGDDSALVEHDPAAEDEDDGGEADA